MFADRLVQALRKLDINDPESVKRFKRAIRQNFEIFLRFTHRYWFHEVADQAQARALFRLCAQHLDLDGLYKEVKERIYDMNEYLDSDSLRRQANTVLRLTVVTTFGLIGTVATGFLGMNLFAHADKPPGVKLLYLLLVLVPTIGLTVYTVARSKALVRFPRGPVGRAAHRLAEIPGAARRLASAATGAAAMMSGAPNGCQESRMRP